MMTRKRIGALLLCIGLILVLSVSAAFLAHEAGHDCEGEECPVCRMIAVNIGLLRAVGLALLVFLSLFFLLPALPAGRRQGRRTFFRPGTPVSWKIRLND